MLGPGDTLLAEHTAGSGLPLNLPNEKNPCKLKIRTAGFRVPFIRQEMMTERKAS
jgi:hypothetical protein